MTAASLQSFQKASIGSEMALFGRDCTIAGKCAKLLIREIDALEAAAGGFENASGQLNAQLHDETAPAIHSLVVVDGKNYRIKGIRSSGLRHSLTLNPTNSTK